MIARLLAVAGVALAVAITGPTAEASALTLGSTLEHEYEATFGGKEKTVYQQNAAGETLVVPAAGTITSWSVGSGDMGAKYELRVIRPTGESMTAAGTSEVVTVPDSEPLVRGPFKVSLPVKAGDRIALDVIAGIGAPITTLAPMEDELNYVEDPFKDGATKKPALTMLGTNQELLLQATFQPSPVNTALPSISGEARAGVMLTATEGSWENATSYAFQWQRCVGTPCTPIAGATSSTYTPSVEDEGAQLRVEVTATGEGGKATAVSERTSGVKPGAPAAPANTGLPTISGEARETETLTGTNGFWLGGPTRFEDQWLRCSSAAGTECAPVPGATAATYKLVHADSGSTMRLQVTAVNGIGATTVLSAPSAIVQPLRITAKLAISPAPSCTGVTTVFDASGSITPNPPFSRYRVTYHDVPLFWPFFIGEHETEAEYFAKQPFHALPDSSSPTFTATFTWNRSWTHELDYGLEEQKAGQLVRDPIYVTLEVTDSAGATASTSQWLYFAKYGTQYSGPEDDLATGRAGCPTVKSVVELARLKVLFRSVVTKATAFTTIKCAAVAPCVGSLSIARLHARLARTAAVGPAPGLTPGNPRNPGAGGPGNANRRQSRLIATTTFFTIRGHHTATIGAKLTALGRRLLKRTDRVKAVERITTVSAGGKTATRSVAVTLRRR